MAQKESSGHIPPGACRDVVRPGQVILGQFRQVEDIVMLLLLLQTLLGVLLNGFPRRSAGLRGPIPPGHRGSGSPGGWCRRSGGWSRATFRLYSTPLPGRRASSAPGRIFEGPPPGAGRGGGKPRLFSRRSRLIIERRKRESSSPVTRTTRSRWPTVFHLFSSFFMPGSAPPHRRKNMRLWWRERTCSLCGKNVFSPILGRRHLRLKVFHGDAHHQKA